MLRLHGVGITIIAALIVFLLDPACFAVAGTIVAASNAPILGTMRLGTTMLQGTKVGTRSLAALASSCTPSNGYPWQNGQCLNASDLNSAFEALGLSSLSNWNPIANLGQFRSGIELGACALPGVPGALCAQGPIDTAGTTVAGLPACTAALHGAIYHVTDAASPAAGQPVTGGGATETLVECNGASWLAVTGASISGITQLTGPVTTASGSGPQAATITPTGVTAGCYTLGSYALTVNAAGQITSLVSGACGAASLTADNGSTILTADDGATALQAN